MQSPEITRYVSGPSLAETEAKAEYGGRDDAFFRGDPMSVASWEGTFELG